MNKKYHVSDSEQIVLCQASERSCPRGHYYANSEEEAYSKHERHLAQKENVLPKGKNLLSVLLAQRIDSLYSAEEFSYSDIEKVGKPFNQIARSELKKNGVDVEKTFRTDFSEEDLERIREANARLMGQFFSNGKTFNGGERVWGSLNSPFGQETTALPESILIRLEREKVQYKSMSASNTGHVGSYLKEKHNLPLSLFFADNEYHKITLVQRPDDEDSFQKRFNDGTSIHEFAHFVTEVDRGRYRIGNYPEDQLSSEFLSINNDNDPKDFPHPIMDLTQPDVRQEKILGYASEEFWVPGATAAGTKGAVGSQRTVPLLYGKDRAKYADQILDFTAGWWIQQAVLADKENKQHQERESE